jgi:hypothetical protein
MFTFSSAAVYNRPRFTAMTDAEIADVVLKTVGLCGAAVAFFAGLAQYARAQRWKRSEWVAQEMRQFFSDPAVRRALLMIDWSGREISFPAEDGEGVSRVRVSDTMVADALKHHSERPEGFQPDETLIRDTFDRFLDGLERFASFRAAGLVSTEDIKPYLAYWIHHIRSARGLAEDRRLVQLRSYIEQYGFRGVQQLFEDYKTDPLLSGAQSEWWRYTPSSEPERVVSLK